MLTQFLHVHAAKTEDGRALILQFVAADERGRQWFVTTPIIEGGEADIPVFANKILAALQTLHFICADPDAAERQGMLQPGTVASASLDAEIRQLTADCGPTVH